MKTTINTDDGGALIVNPATDGERLCLGIRLRLNGQSVMLTPSKAGALIFAIESALDVMAMRRRALRPPDSGFSELVAPAFPELDFPELVAA